MEAEEEEEVDVGSMLRFRGRWVKTVTAWRRIGPSEGESTLTDTDRVDFPAESKRIGRIVTEPVTGVTGVTGIGLGGGKESDNESLSSELRRV